MATPREQLANLLRQARLDAGYESHAALAKRLSMSRPVVSKAENPSSPTPSDAVLAAWAGATGAGLDELTKLGQQARSGPPGWFAGWTDDIEACASVIRWFEPLLIPGLIQTKAYANAVLSWKPESASTEANLKNRLARQSLLERAELRTVILESVLYREVGDAATMGEQVEHLLSIGGRPTVTLQVLPDTCALPLPLCVDGCRHGYREDTRSEQRINPCPGRSRQAPERIGGHA